jgi:hypothetical protein
MTELAKKASLEATWDRSSPGYPPQKQPPHLGKRWRGPADRLDYMIRRCVIPDHPANNDGTVARALPYRLSAPYLSWELTRTLSSGANSTRLNSLLSDLQTAIGRGLCAQFDFRAPMPGRLVALLTRLDEPARP